MDKSAKTREEIIRTVECLIQGYLLVGGSTDTPDGQRACAEMMVERLDELDYTHARARR
jgi:hypothetical protein